eukprot:437135-Karenia_brevis.AAC.1
MLQLTPCPHNKLRTVRFTASGFLTKERGGNCLTDTEPRSEAQPIVDLVQMQTSTRPSCKLSRNWWSK